MILEHSIPALLQEIMIRTGTKGSYSSAIPTKNSDRGHPFVNRTQMRQCNSYALRKRLQSPDIIAILLGHDISLSFVNDLAYQVIKFMFWDFF